MMLVELLIVIAIITTSLVYLLGLINFSLRIAGEKKRLYQANFIAQEAMEGVRNFRDGTSWDVDGLGTLAVSTPYHVEKTGSPPRWTLSAGEQTTDGFTQRVIFDEVQRDGNDNIVESGGVVDASTTEVTMTISWLERGESRQIELVNFFTNWRK